MRRYNDHNIQDELLKLLAQNHFIWISSGINEAGYFAVQPDYLTNSSNQEQLFVCVPWLDAQFQAYEDFIGLHHLAGITSATIVGVLKDTVLHLNSSVYVLCTMLQWSDKQ